MVLITLLSNIYQQLAPLVPPGLACCIASAFIVDKKYFGAFRAEFIGTILMIGLTFSPGKWIGADSLPIAWVAHAAGVVAAGKSAFVLFYHVIYAFNIQYIVSVI